MLAARVDDDRHTSYDPRLPPELHDRILSLIGDQFDEGVRGLPEGSGAPTRLVLEFRELAEASPAEALQIAVRQLEQRLWELPDDALADPVSPPFVREIDRWGVVGIAWLTPDRAELAGLLYRRLLLAIRRLQERANTRLHKGTPYHWLGTANALRERFGDAREYFLLGAVEDALLSAEWRVAPAATVLGVQWNAESEHSRVEQMRERALSHLARDELMFVRNPELLLLESGL